MIGAEIIITLFIIIPTILWLMLNFFHLNYKMNRNRKRFKKALKKEGLPETVSAEIAEHIFPKIGLSQMFTLMGRGSVGKQDR